MLLRMSRSLALLLGVVAFSLPTAQSSSKWDVQAPFGPTTEVVVRHDEGTWMNVDVSPDGRRLVFDLLGDIYTMPIEGGTATRVLGGAAFEMQPRFSPDGAAHRVHERPRRPLEHLDDEDRRHGSRSRSREERAVVHQQPDVGAGRPGDLRAAALRDDAIARRRRSVDVSRRADPTGLQVTTRENAAEGRRRARDFAGRQVPLLLEGRHARARCSNTTRIPNGVIFAILRRDLHDRARDARSSTGRADR